RSALAPVPGFGGTTTTSGCSPGPTFPWIFTLSSKVPVIVFESCASLTCPFTPALSTYRTPVVPRRVHGAGIENVWLDGVPPAVLMASVAPFAATVAGSRLSSDPSSLASTTTCRLDGSAGFGSLIWSVLPKITGCSVVEVVVDVVVVVEVVVMTEPTGIANAPSPSEPA